MTYSKVNELLNAGFISEDTKNELRELLAKAKNGATEIVQTIAKTVTKFIKKVAIEKQTKTINLKDFFTAGKKDQPLYIWDNFKAALDDATSDEVNAPTDPDQFFLHETTKTAADNDVMNSVKENIIDLSTAEGRLEARKRFGALAHLLSNQPTGQDGYLQTNGYSTIIGWMKLKSGNVLTVRCGWDAGDRRWRCNGSGQGEWCAGHQFFSRNGEA